MYVPCRVEGSTGDVTGSSESRVLNTSFEGQRSFTVDDIDLVVVRNRNSEDTSGSCKAGRFYRLPAFSSTAMQPCNGH